jgi:chromosome segregation ATPase
MDTQELQAEITAITQAIAQLENSAAEAIVKRLLNLLERVVEDYASVEKELQELRNEINRLKGEHGKPDVKANKKKDTDVSSEEERKKAEAMANGDGGNGNGDDSPSSDENKKKRQRKIRKIKIDREQICPLDKEGLPDDLEFKGYEEVVVQNIIIKTDNVKYLREVYYSPSQHQSYLG